MRGTLSQGDIEQGYIITLHYPSKQNRATHAVFAYRLDNKWGVLSNNALEFRLPSFATLHGAITDINNARDAKDHFLLYKVHDYAGVDLVNGSEDMESKIKEREDLPLFP